MSSVDSPIGHIMKIEACGHIRRHYNDLKTLNDKFHQLHKFS